MKDPIVEKKNILVEIWDNGDLFWTGFDFDQMLGAICQTQADYARAALGVLKQLGAMENRIIELTKTVQNLFDGPRCCGHQWRNKADRLYMHHSLKEDCPMHGPAPDGADRGLRSYVKAEEEESTLAAAANFELWKIRKQELRQLEHKRDSLARKLKGLAHPNFRGWQ